MTDLIADGIHFGMSDEEYHADPAMSASSIADLHASPTLYWAKSHMNKLYKPKKTKALFFGELCHKAVYDPSIRAMFEIDKSEYTAVDLVGLKSDRYTKTECKISDADELEIDQILQALRTSCALDLIDDSVPEVAFFWTDKSGFRCKIKLDGLRPSDCSDLKTYENAVGKDTETAVAHAVANYRYHIKAYWYRIGIEKMLEMVARNAQSLEWMADVYDPKRKYGDEQISQFISEIDTKGEFPHWYIFVEKGGVPNVTVRKFTPTSKAGDMNEYWKAAKDCVTDATNDYARYMNEFGEDKPWVPIAKHTGFTDEEFGAAPWITRI